MNIKEFRIIHSTMIEHYQFIELHLEGIYAQICGKEFVCGLRDVEKSSISRLIQQIKKIEAERQIKILSDLDYEKLEHICTRRNYWCHECYTNMAFDRKTNAPKEKYLLNIIEDLKEAETLRDSLFQKKMSLIDMNSIK